VISSQCILPLVVCMAESKYPGGPVPEEKLDSFVTIRALRHALTFSRMANLEYPKNLAERTTRRRMRFMR
jgi:hypothetical protein